MEKNFELKLQLHGCPYAVGSKTKTLIAFEDEYGKDPENMAGRTFNLPFNTNALAASQNTTAPETITGRRDPVEPILGNIDNAGTAVVPLDLTAFGVWLRAMFGLPETTAADSKPGYYKHVFKLQEDQPSFVLEKSFPGIGQYLKSNGVMVSSCSITVGGDGELTASIELMGAKEVLLQSTISSAPTDMQLDRVNNFQASVKVGGEAAGLATEGTIEINFGLDGDSYVIGGGGYRVAICPGTTNISGTLTVYFKDSTYLDLAQNSTETSIEYLFTVGDMSMSILLPEVKFALASQGIDGPGGLQTENTYNAYYKDNEENSAIVVTLINKTASYADPAAEGVSLGVPAGDVYGKQATDLATGLVISADGKVTGNLRHVTGYTGFSSEPSEQSGFYLPFTAQFPDGTTTATMQVEGGKNTPVSILGEAANVVWMGALETEAETKTVVIKWNDGTDHTLRLDTSALDYLEE